MATRANVIIKHGKEKIHLYHHYDGYKEGVGADLQGYMDKNKGKSAREIADGLVGSGKNNSTGSKYEHTNGVHSDSEFVYTIDLDKGSLRVKEWDWNKDKWKKSETMSKFNPSPMQQSAEGGNRISGSRSGGSKSTAKGNVNG